MTPRKKKVVDRYDLVAETAQGWSDAVLNCRLLGHSWAQDGNPIHHRRERYYDVTFYCTRGCGCTRPEEWTERGHVTKKKPVYPKVNGKDTYLNKGQGRIGAEEKGALRMETLSRTSVKEVD